MRIVTPFVLALVLLGSAGAASRPTLRITDDQPLVLRGAGFRPGEHVKVSVYAGTAGATKRMTATARGVFRARFANLDANACSAFGASAIGDKGSRAIYKRAPGMCPAP